MGTTRKSFSLTFANPRYKDSRDKRNQDSKKKVRCVNDGVVYDSMKQASDFLPISQSLISLSVKNKKEYKGLKFELVK